RTTIEQLLSRNRFDAAEWLRATDCDEAVHLLAAATVEIAAELLDVMLGRDPARVVELLAAGEHGRARQGGAGVADGGGAGAGGGGPVADVPEAAHAILRHATTHPTGPGLGARQGGLLRAAPSPKGTTGYSWIFANGVISWCARGGARTTMGPVLAFYNQR